MKSHLPRRLAQLLRDRDAKIAKVKLDFDKIIAVELEKHVDTLAKPGRVSAKKAKPAKKMGRPLLPPDPDKPWRRASKAITSER